MAKVWHELMGLKNMAKVINETEKVGSIDSTVYTL